jgi:hypothetical protein
MGGVGSENSLVMQQRVRIGVLAAMMFLAAGCGGGGLDVREGCASGDTVKGPVKAAVEVAAQEFYARARRGDWTGIYENAAQAARSHGPQQSFVAPIVRVFQELGVPARLETQAIAVVKFGPEFPHAPKVSCGDSKRPMNLILTDYPQQASLVQRATVGSEQFYFSTLWHGEESGWRLAALFVKPATLLGRDWQSFKKEAEEQKTAGNQRNAALLYNAAIDLVLPNAWTEPPEVKDIQREQGRISVSNLPKKDPDTWYAPPDSFRVHSIAYAMAENNLCLYVRYEAKAALADTVAQKQAADRLGAYLEKTFPEYAQVFRVLALEAFDPRHPDQTWSRLTPLRPSS